MNVEWYLLGIFTGLVLFFGSATGIGAYYYFHPQKAVRYFFRRNDKAVARNAKTSQANR